MKIREKMKKGFTLAEVLTPKRTSGAENEVICSRESKEQAPLSLNRKLVAFTLAEVLITLAVIGIVAALTIPAVVHKYQQHVLYTQFITAYQMLNNALQASSIENGPMKDWIEDDLINTRNGGVHCRPIIENLPIEKSCKNDATCFSGEYKKFNGDPPNHAIRYIIGSFHPYLLKNGMILMNRGSGGNLPCFMDVDINGKKGPNVVGRDLFSFIINEALNTYEPYGFGSKVSTEYYRNKCLTEGSGYYCGAYLIKNKKMDY